MLYSDWEPRRSRVMSGSARGMEFSPTLVLFTTPSPKLISTLRSSRVPTSLTTPWSVIGVPTVVSFWCSATAVGATLPTFTTKTVVALWPCSSVAVSSTLAGPMLSHECVAVLPVTGSEYDGGAGTPWSTRTHSIQPQPRCWKRHEYVTWWSELGGSKSPASKVTGLASTGFAGEYVGWPVAAAGPSMLAE